MHWVETEFSVKDSNEVEVHELFAIGCFVRITGTSTIIVRCKADQLDQVYSILGMRDDPETAQRGRE
jgi:hypothetical protein